MKRTLSIVLIIVAPMLVILFLVTGMARANPSMRPLLQGGAPTVVSYQGQVIVDSIPYSGTSYFRFVIVNVSGSTTFWSNDGTSTGGGQPTNAVQLTVSDGLFNVLLGDTSLTHMMALPATVFDGTDRALRVWFSSDGSSFTLLSPDRRIVAAPYALQAEEARNADTVDGQHASAFAPAGTLWSLTGNAGTNPASNFLGTTDSQPLVFRTNGAERMRLDTSGRLGLGTIPGTGAPLTIRGTGAGSQWLQLMDASGANQWHLNYLDGGLNFAESGVSDFRLYLEDGGEVGIGIGAPTARLHVQNSTGAVTGRFTNLTTGASTRGIVATTDSATDGTRAGSFNAQGATGATYAIYALNSSDTDNAAAGYFKAAGATGMMTGVWADVNSINGSSTAGFFRNQGSAGFAGWFVGDVRIQGTLSKSAGSFTIDHPLDPADQTLSHSFVESPDMMNVYNGNVVLDENGEAWVQLPDWFEALNKDYRYQLTCIGGFAPVYIASEIEDNRFQIAGGSPGLKVSWQVTGIRRDPYAEMYRIPVEQDKPEGEQGEYLCPECYGLPRASPSSVGDVDQSADPYANPTR